MPFPDVSAPVDPDHFPEALLLTERIEAIYGRAFLVAIADLSQIMAAPPDAGGRRGTAAVTHAFERGVIISLAELCGGDPVATLRLSAMLAECAHEDDQAAALRARVRQLAGPAAVFPQDIFPPAA
jgi:hypothetical protein